MIVEVLAWIIAAPLVALSCYLALEVALGLVPLNRNIDSSSVPSGLEIAVLVPAHNEVQGIGETVKELLQVSPKVSVFVVADNCTDGTAAMAREAGAEVFERFDLCRLGKGHALAFGREKLAANPPEVVIVIDADCRLAPQSAGRLAVQCLITQRPVQAANLLTAPPAVQPIVAISNFAMIVKNLVRARGMARLSGGALLFGTGMAFPWPLFAKLPLASSTAVEDLELGLRLARQGVCIEFDDASLVSSPAASADNSRGQRSRWEHGFLQIALREALPLLGVALRRRSRHLLVISAHLLVPPLALYVLTSVLLLGLLFALCFAGTSFLPLLTSATAFGTALAFILLAWARDGRRALTFRALLWTPLYVVWKVPVYLSYFMRRQTGWNRTRRGNDAH